MLRVAASAVLILIIIGAGAFEGALDQLRRASPLAVALAVAIVFFWLSVISALRWTIVVAAFGSRLGFVKAMQGAVIGAFFNQTPLSLIGGDAMRAWCGYRAGLDLQVAFRTVILDRLIGVATLVLIIAVSMPWMLQIVSDPLARATLWTTVVAGLSALVALVAMGRWSGRFRRWLGLPAVAFRARYFVPVAGLSVLTHALAGVVLFVIARGIDAEIGFFHALVVAQPVMLVAMLPISVAGWGVREGAMVVALGYLGIQAGTALVISVIFGLAGMLASVPGLILWMIARTDAPVPAMK